MTAGDEFRIDTAPRHRRRWPWVIVFVVVITLLVAAGSAAAYLWRLSSSYEKAQSIPVEQVFPTVRPAEANPEAVNVLLLGSDTRNGLGADIDDIRGQRADTIMLAHIPADRSGVQVISFMRDNWVDIPGGYGKHKLNAALAFGGVPLLVQTIEGITDVRIDHVVITDFGGFKGLTEALDGVTVNNSIPFRAQGITFAQGPIELRGAAALAYVRERYSFRDGDYQRVRNQQAFLKGVIDRLLSAETLTDPGRIAASVDAMAPYLMVDERLDAGTVGSLALSLRDVRSGDVLFLTAPTKGVGTSDDGQSIVIPDEAGLAALSDALKNDTVPEYAAARR